MSEQIRFTEQGIDRIAPRGARFIVWDRSRPGLGLRVTPKGAKTFVLAYRFDGKSRMHTIGNRRGLDLREAFVAYNNAMEKIHRAQHARAHGQTPAPELDPAGTKRAARQATVTAETVAQVWASYAAKKRPGWRARTAAEYDRMWKAYVQELAPKRARDVRPRDVKALLDRVAETGPVQANRVRALVAAIFNFAVDQFIIEASPVKIVRRIAKEQARERAITDEAELRGFLAAIDAGAWVPAVRDALLMTLATGCRPGEATAMRWQDIDEAAEVWTIPDEFAKTGQAHEVPLSTFAAALVSMRRAAGIVGPWVFPDASGEKRLSRNALHLALSDRAELLAEHNVAPVRPHDLRRTCRSWLSKLRIPEHIAERVIGHLHKDTIVRTYDVHNYLQEKREALELWSATLTAMRAGVNVVAIARRTAA